jgi:hypothetical protein
VKTRFSISSAWQLALVLVAAPVGAADTTPPPPSFSPRAQSFACAPRTVADRTASPRVLGGRDRLKKGMFAPGETVVVGMNDGSTVAVGQLYVAYRPPRSAVSDGQNPWTRRAAQNAGIVRVDAITGSKATATIVWACDGVDVGDRLEPYASPAAAADAPAGAGTARFDQASTVVFGGQDRRLGAARDFLLVERAQGLDVAPGQHVTFFRRPYGVDGPVSIVGEGVVQQVSADSYLVEVASSRDAIGAGDLAATHR